MVLPVLAGCVGGATDNAPAVSVARAPARPALPASLIGLSDEALRHLLGRPAVLRREPPGEVWQYAGAECVLLVVFYRPETGGRLVVARADALVSPDAATPAAVRGAIPTERCLETLTRSRAGVES